CSRLLRQHPIAAGLDPRFAVLDEPRAARLRERAFGDALRGFLAAGAPGRFAAGDLARTSFAGGQEALDLVAAYQPDALRRMILAVHDALRSEGHERPRLPQVAPRPAPDAEREAL